MQGLWVYSFVFFILSFVGQTRANERPYAVFQNQNLGKKYLCIKREDVLNAGVTNEAPHNKWLLMLL